MDTLEQWAESLTMREDPSIASLRARDVAAWEQLVETYHTPLTGFVCNVLGGWCEDVPDLVQDVLLKVYRSIGEFREESSLRTWIFRITLNACRDHRKSVWRQRVLLESDAGTEMLERGVSLPSSAAPAGAHSEWEAALTALPDEERICIELRYFQELSGREIAHVVGCNQSTVFTRIYAGIKRLRLAAGERE